MASGLDHRVHVSRREHLIGIRAHAQIGDVILDVRPPVEDTRWDDNHVTLVNSPLSATLIGSEARRAVENPYDLGKL